MKCNLTVNTNGMWKTVVFTYKVAISPILYSASPIKGGTQGGSLLTINGFGFPYNFDFKIILSKIKYYNIFF
jgi:hypothetical protein